MALSDRANDVQPGDIISVVTKGGRATVTIATVGPGQRQLTMPVSSLTDPAIRQALAFAADVRLLQAPGMRRARKDEVRTER